MAKFAGLNAQVLGVSVDHVPCLVAWAESLGQIKKKERAILDIRDDLLETDAILRKYDFQKNSLIQVLLDVQERFRWLPRHILSWIGGRLNIPLRDIYIVANFYEEFSLEPRGRHTVQVCTGTACHVRGASEMLTRVSATLGIQAGETDSKQAFTLETVHCLGCCALAPVAVVDETLYGHMAPSKVEGLILGFQIEKEREERERLEHESDRASKDNAALQDDTQ